MTAAIALVVIACAIAAHFYSPPHATVLISTLLRSLHGPGFALLTALFWWLAARSGLQRRRYVVAVAAAGLVAMISEIAQIPGPRDAEWRDLLVDALGIATAAALIAVFDPSVRHRYDRLARRALPPVAGVLFAATSYPSLWTTYALLRQYAAVPEILTFEHRWEAITYALPDDTPPELRPAPPDWPASGKTIALLRKGARDRVFLIVHPRPDWRDYKGLSFVAGADGEPFSLDVAIRYSDPESEAPSRSFEKSFALSAGARRFSIAFDELGELRNDRKTGLRHVESLTFSPTRQGFVQRLLIDDIRLE